MLIVMMTTMTNMLMTALIQMSHNEQVVGHNEQVETEFMGNFVLFHSPVSLDHCKCTEHWKMMIIMI